MAMHTFSAIPDIGPDKKSGIKTLATSLGQSKTLAYCGSCWFASSILFALVDVRLGIFLSSYLAILGIIVLRKIEVEVAYWWYPKINTIIGFVLVIGGIWRIVI